MSANRRTNARNDRHPVVAKTCLKCREALMNVAKQSRSIAVSSACSNRVPLTTFRNNGRSPACVIVLDIPRNMFATSWQTDATAQCLPLLVLLETAHRKLTSRFIGFLFCLLRRQVSAEELRFRFSVRQCFRAYVHTSRLACPVRTISSKHMDEISQNFGSCVR